MENNEKIENLSILDIKNNTNIFETNIKYQIPIYQRDFEWEDEEIAQLIEDINNIELKEDNNYYLGSLIVYSKNNFYEIIDGQQRLTTLYLLLNCIGEKTKETLTFECREKSNNTLINIEKIITNWGNYNSKENENAEYDENENNIINAITIIKRELKNINLEDFRKKLAKVIIFKIEVPENTDLNKYFEIMNKRGTPLKDEDKLKAILMSYLSNEKDRNIFINIWDACSNMDNYVKNNFSEESIGTKVMKSNYNWEDYKNINFKNMNSDKSLNIDEIISTSFKPESFKNFSNKEELYRSILDFSIFLLHILAVYKNLHNPRNEDKGKEVLDDLKLLKTFREYIKQEENKEKFSKEFLILLFKCRVLFDEYFIKRKNEKWDLKYKNENVLMLQTLLRVTYTSRKSARWITELFYWLTENNFINTKEENINDFENKIEDFIRAEVIEKFFKMEKPFSKGTDTHHIVFNYLDYLLWKENKEKYKDFTFEFRNSVEHWYPQNPSEGTFDKWENETQLNYFGNLCLVTTQMNSKLSNRIPSSKRESFLNSRNKGSIKLRIMAEETTDHNGKNANIYWKEEGYLLHGREMIKKLAKACNIDLKEIEY